MIRACFIVCACFLLIDSIGQDQFISTPLERGLIRSGQRAGIWQYFDSPGELGLEINYETMEVLDIKPDTSAYAVWEGDRWVKRRLKYPCRPHGSMMYLLEHYRLKLDAHNAMFSRADRKNERVETFLTFEVGAEGVSSNPKVWGYTKFGMEKEIMEAYQSAPNLWIPGVKMDGSVATCRFGLYIKICPDFCPEAIPAPSDTVRMLYGGSNYKLETTGRNPVTSEPVGMVLSPNGEWIAMNASIMANTGGTGFFVISTGGGGQRHITYGNVQGIYWPDNTNIAFKYSYSLSGTLHGNYNLATGLVESRKDSLSFFERISPDRKTLLAGKIRNDFLEVVKLSLTTGTSEWIARQSEGDMFPVVWSPNNQACVMKGRKDQMDIIYLLDVGTKKLATLPVMDAEPCGWSFDGGQVFFQRVIHIAPHAYPFVPTVKGQILAVDTKTNLLSEVTEKMDKFVTAEFSSGANQFLMIRNKNLYLFSQSEAAKPRKIVNDVSYAVWSHDGKSIAYVSEEGTLLSIYEVSTGKRRILYNTSRK